MPRGRIKSRQLRVMTFEVLMLCFLSLVCLVSQFTRRSRDLYRTRSPAVPVACPCDSERLSRVILDDELLAHRRLVQLFPDGSGLHGACEVVLVELQPRQHRALLDGGQ